MSLFGTRISFTIHPSGWLLVSTFIVLGYRSLGLQMSIVGGLLITLSLVVHELAHVVSALYFAVPVREVGLKFIGAYTMRKYASRRFHDVLIAAAGPFANVVLVIASAFVPKVGIWLMEWNLLFAAVNLLPFPGTDGYRILKTMFWPDRAIYAAKHPAIEAEAA